MNSQMEREARGWEGGIVMMMERPRKIALCMSV